MRNEWALEVLERSAGPSLSERLRAARFLARHATQQDRQRLSSIRASERNSWVRQALDQSLTTASRTDGSADSSVATVDSEVLEFDSRFPEELRAQATEETAAFFLHELRPLVGLADAAAADEIMDYGSSKTKVQLDRIKAYLEAVSRLRQASAAPASQEFDLTDTVAQIADEEVARGRATLGGADDTAAGSRYGESGEEEEGPKVHLILARSEPVVTFGDRTLVALAVANALRNAGEAVLARTDGERGDVIVNWGTTDSDSWIVVLDEGCGLPEGWDRVDEPGTSTKSKADDHFGMGLPIAKRAIESMRGSLRLTPRSGVGVSCEIRWPRDGLDG